MPSINIFCFSCVTNVYRLQVERILVLGQASPWLYPTTLLVAHRPHRLMTVKDINVRVRIILDMLYPSEWLEERAEGDPAGRTNREIQTEVIFPTSFCEP
jgi:hypothetical protein